MKLWMSGEVYKESGDGFFLARKTVEPWFNELFADRTFSKQIERINIIAIIMPADLLLKYKEKYKFHGKKSSADFRLQIPYDDFVSASEEGQCSLLAGLILRSSGMLKSLGVDDFNESAFKLEFDEALKVASWKTSTLS